MKSKRCIVVGSILIALVFVFVGLFAVKSRSLGDRYVSSKSGAESYTLLLSCDQITFEMDGEVETFDCTIKPTYLLFGHKAQPRRKVFYFCFWNRLQLINPNTGEVVDILYRDWSYLPPYFGAGRPDISDP